MRSRIWIGTMVLALGTVACGANAVAGPTTTSPALETTTTTEATTTTTAVPTTIAAPTTTTTVAATTTTASASPTTTALRGNPVDMGPPAGAILAVIGVRHDDVLNLRARPGADQPIVGRIPPTYDNLIARGETRSLPAFWTKVRYQGTEGWVNMSYVAYLGSTDDTTAQVIDHFGERPEASTMTELGRIVAEASASDDPPSKIVNSVKESIGDLGEVTFDVVGLGDDAVRGVRLHVFGERVDDHWRLRTVEQTVFCHPTRGVDEGSCV
ncbi:MAG: SH3 domain-containing protein [Acidimicrobiia bacterium]